jgi:hypothetical protein
VRGTDGARAPEKFGGAFGPRFLDDGAVSSTDLQAPVRIGFSTPKAFNPVSWVVKRATGSRASHAFFVYFDVDFEMEVVLEAHELGFRLIPRAHFERGNRIVKLVSPRHAVDVGLKKVAHRYLGSMYDYAGLFGMVVVLVGRWLSRKWKNPFRGSKSVYCSEAVILAMKASAGYETLGLHSDSSPQDLLDYFEQVLR